MALTEIQKAQVDKLLTEYCARRVPAHIRSQVRVGYRIDGSAVTLYEERPDFRAPDNWHSTVVAKFTYVGTQGEWRLYCQHRDLQWHAYRALPRSSSLAKPLEEVDADPSGIFWG